MWMAGCSRASRFWRDCETHPAKPCDNVTMLRQNDRREGYGYVAHITPNSHHFPSAATSRTTSASALYPACLRR